ncbi:DUF3098 domain-containing protein [Xylanibacter rodentium]|jgi:membrane-bound ClpP family serine protease|uniref:DUF3098 domain-containing protein n=1 Tax=Xylanibacter rodentium TaxID=2736289 RepID=A0ABX2AZ95_9BACT|nr:DUF3098 domain-containing protein [Xylanibacter rodentium]NPE11852.1 DUF3098 domain-containing protein [Prevotella sp. PJ1A]NPE14788.1 DUF3098 domain-containing protein [Xylanibacter rodentium]NPE39711.1 DUF3098 domain-containing protein [Prevotella sp. PCJ2]
MDKRNFAFDRMNFILLAVGMAVVIIGFLLMSGPGSTDTTYEPDIFSVRRIKIAPVVCLVGFVSIIYAIVRKPKDTDIIVSEEEKREETKVI